MSLLIKGMEMPTSCACCKIKRRNGKKMVCPLCDEEWDIHDPMSADYRLDSCPLVLVSPHGRLIDADALRQDWLENGENEYVYDTNAFLDSLDYAPTIIDAEVEQE